MLIHRAPNNVKCESIQYALDKRV